MTTTAAQYVIVEYDDEGPTRVIGPFKLQEVAKDLAKRMNDSVNAQYLYMAVPLEMK